MNTLYATFGSGNCFKAHLIMHQLSLPHQVHWIDVLKGEQKEPAFLDLNPNGTVPFLLTAEGKGIAESNAMTWYLGKGSQLFPSSAMAEAETIQWMIFEQTKLEPFISPARFFSVILPERKTEMATQIADWQTRAALGMERLNTHLSARSFMVDNHYSIADISVYGYVHVADEAGLDFGLYPAIGQWIERVQNQPGYCPILSFKPAA
ncbi:MAG: glutathione S-transferase family protein [Cohaesibacter sp.]|jgi:glutathione S-transferase|nr:glutathione S-transferase family protein [Cohaesibacter sp.]